MVGDGHDIIVAKGADTGTSIATLRGNGYLHLIELLTRSNGI